MGDYQNRRAILKELLENGELINGTILTEDGGVFKVHLEILAGRSPYLKRIISAAKGSPWKNILIPGIPKDVIASIVDFIYTDQIQISSESVDNLLKTGELLEMPDVITFCKKFLVSNLKDENCVEIFIKYSQHCDIKEEAKTYMVARFQQIFPVSSDYLKLSEEDLVALLSSDRLNLIEEEYVFWAIMRWIENDPLIRVTSLPNLLRCVRFGLCDSQFYKRNISSNPYVLGNEECQAIVLQASQLFEDIKPTTNRYYNSMLDTRHPFLRPRTPNEIIFVMGGWSSGSATNVIETFDVKSNRWFLSLATDSGPRAYHGMLWHKGYIYVLGGFDGNTCFNSVKRFNPVTHVWEERGCMYEKRCYVSVAVVGDGFYAMGGYDGNLRTRSCERYDPDNNQWGMVASMNQVRSDASADTLHGKVYIAGGFNGQSVLSSAECYDPSTDKWTAIREMNSPRSGVKLVAYFDHLYIIGGFNGNNRLSTVEKFDPQTKLWLEVPSMQGPRSNFATAVLCDSLYVIGGFNGLATVSSAECFNHKTNTWIPVTEMNLNRSALAACTVKEIPNVQEYTFIGNAPYT